MSSSTDTVIALQATQKYLFRFVSPVMMLLGTISCILNLIIFTRKKLRKNSCSLYFIAYNITNLIVIYCSLLCLTLDVGYNIDPSVYSTILCRLRLYMTILLNILSPFYLVLASIDRMLITSSNALTRQRSTRRLAYISITIVTLFWSLFHIHALIASNIIQVGAHYFTCYYQQGFHLAFVSNYSIIKGILILSSMTVCGLRSIKNVRTVRRVRVAPNLSLGDTAVENSSHSTSSKDRQLTFMLFMDIIICVLFSVAFAIFLMYQQITQGYNKSVGQMQIEISIRNICLFTTSIPFCASCYTNLIVSKTYRKELKKVFLCQ